MLLFLKKRVRKTSFLIGCPSKTEGLEIGFAKLMNIKKSSIYHFAKMDRFKTNYIKASEWQIEVLCFQALYSKALHTVIVIKFSIKI